MGRANFAAFATILRTKRNRDRLLIEHPEQGVHLLAVQTGRKAAALGKGPWTTDEIRVVAFIQFESRNALGNKLTQVIIGKYPACLGLCKIGDQPAPNGPVSGMAPEFGGN